MKEYFLSYNYANANRLYGFGNFYAKRDKITSSVIKELEDWQSKELKEKYNCDINVIILNYIECEIDFKEE